MNLGPRSGKLRDGSNGSHLGYVQHGGKGARTAEGNSPEVVEVVRECTAEEPVVPNLLSARGVKLVVREEDREPESESASVQTTKQGGPTQRDVALREM